MRFVHALLFFCVLLTAGPAAALRCAAPEVMAAVAKPRGVSESPWQVCAIDDERALHLSGVLESSLVRARGYVDVVFYDQRGRRLWRARRGPWLGRFSDLALDESLPVPAGATQVRIAAATESRMAEADGRWTIGDLRIVRGVVATLEAAGNSVIPSGVSAGWSVKLVPPSVEGSVRLELFNVDGEAVDVRTGVYRADSPLVLDFGVLAPGYYDARLHVDSVEGPAAVVSGAVAVLPAGVVPSEPRFGMDAALSWYGGTTAMVERSVAMMRLAGVGSVRDRLSWSRTQPVRGKTDWGVHAEVAEAAAKAGLAVVQTFHDAPPWTRGEASGPSDRQPPRDDAAAFDFGRAYARGLGRLARSVEYWNEQNSNFFAGYPFQYASGLKAFSAGVQSVDPAIRVLIGAAAGKPGRFFEETYKNGVAPFFDVRNQHFYGDAGELVRFYADHVRGIEADGGVAERPGWLTEIGYSLRRDGSGDWRAAERAQAEYLVKTYAAGFSAGYERVFFFFWRELVEAELHTWGVIREDFSPRPAYMALAVLTRHLANAQVVARENNEAGATVYFRGGDGTYVAVDWGSGRSARLARFSSAVATDLYGRSVDLSLAVVKDDTPILLSGIASLPSTAEPVAWPAAQLRTPAQLRLSAQVSVGGERVSAGGQNRIAIDVNSGAVVEISVGAHAKGASAGADSLVVDCVPGPGLSVEPPSSLNLGRIRPQGARATCRFRVGSALVGATHARVEARYGAARDVVHVALAPNVTAMSFARERTLKGPGSCLSWQARHSRNVQLQIRKEQNFEGGCPAVSMLSRVTDRGETWVFPAAAVDVGALAGAKGVRLVVSSVSGQAPPPTNLLVQLVERSGGIWLVDMRVGEDGKTLTGLLSLARPAPWARDDNGRFDLAKVKEIMVGWGGYGGEPGQHHGFRVEKIDVLSDSN